MSSKRFDPSRPFLTLGVVTILWLLIPIAVKGFTRATFFELTAPLTVAASYARDLQEYWALRMHSNSDLIAAGRDLARLNASYELAVQQNSTLHAEIGRLEDLLGLPSFAEYRYEHARVVRRELSGWWQRLVIRKGRNYGLTAGAPVIFTGGVVGRVTEVHATPRSSSCSAVPNSGSLAWSRAIPGRSVSKAASTQPSGRPWLWSSSCRSTSSPTATSPSGW